MKEGKVSHHRRWGLFPLVLLLSLQNLAYGQAGSAGSFDLQAHRGGMGLVSEGTLAAFANALEMGVTTLELDTQITRDNHVVVTHDRQIQSRNCQDTAPAFANDSQFPYVGKYIKDLSLVQIQTLD